MPIRRSLMTIALTTWAVALDGSSSSTTEIKVVVYEGPESCPVFDADKKHIKVQKDCTVAFHFTASDEATGRKIESSHDLGIAPSFPVGQGKVIPGLDSGLIGLCKHSKAYIIIPPHLAYGQIGKPEQGVTKDTVLRYDVEIIDILPPVPNDFKEIDSNKDWKISRIEAKSYFERKNQNIDLDALFQAEDTDGDGYVSYEEFTGPKGNEGPPSTRQKQPRQQADPLDQVTAIFQTMDRDGDGKIIKRELQETFDALGEHLTDEFWAKSDANGDGHISFAEFVGNEESGDGSGDEEL